MEAELTMRNITEIQWKLIALGFSVGPNGADGKFGADTLAAYNRFRLARGLPAVYGETMSELNRLLFPEEQPAPKPKKPDFFTGLLVNFALSKIKGLPAMNFLSGYKTYVLAILIILCAAAETFLGVDIPEFKMGIGEAIAVGLALITGRAGAKADVAKIQ